MANIKVNPVKKLKGIITVPGDKSISHRAVMLGALAEGTTEIEGFLESEDCLSTMHAFQALGVDIVKPNPGQLIIEGRGLKGLLPPREVLDLGNSGTTMRLLLGILAGQDFCSVLTGDASLTRRPMRRVTEPLRKMGATILGREEGNFAPLAIRGGKLKALKYTSPIPSAQIKSALLLAGLFARGDTSVTEPAKSRDHTERMLKFFGAECWIGGLTVRVKANPKLIARQMTIPGDISSAAFFMMGAAILPGSDITIKNVGINPTRKAILEVIEAMGATVKITSLKDKRWEPRANINIQGAKTLRPIKLTGKIIPRLIDELPIIAVGAALAKGESQIRGAGELRVKETDRIRSLALNLTKLGVDLEELPDGLLIRGGKPLKGNKVDSFGDHRLAMALVIAGLTARGETLIQNAECIGISFPGFAETLQEVICHE